MSAWPWGRTSTSSGESNGLLGPPRGGKMGEDGETEEEGGVERVIWGNAWINYKTDWTLGSRWHTRGSKPPKERNRWQGEAVMIRSIRLWLLISLHCTCLCLSVCFCPCSTPRGWECLDRFPDGRVGLKATFSVGNPAACIILTFDFNFLNVFSQQQIANVTHAPDRHCY